MKCLGYRLSGYDATYRKTLFNVVDKSVDEENRVLEITDMESGTTFLVDFDQTGEPRRRTSKWMQEEPNGQGTTISFGDKGFFEQLKYSGRNPKDNI